MSASFLVLKQALGVTAATDPAPSWGEVMSELWPIISSPLSSDGERLLLDVLHHHGRLHLTETADLPHSLPPEEMLKSLAVQALARWTHLTYLTELQRLELTGASPALQSVVRAVIQTARVNRLKVAPTDAIAEEESVTAEVEEEVWLTSPYLPLGTKPKTVTPKRHVVAKPIRKLGNLTLIDDDRRKTRRHKEEYEYAG